MNFLPFCLVLVSIFTHAYWNYLIKSSNNKHVFTGLSKLAEVIIFAIPAAYFLATTTWQWEYVILIAVAAGITFLNYFFLANAYKYGDLSLVYPVSRSSILFLPIMAFYFIGEQIDTLGALAVLCILVGTLVMHMDSLNLNGLRTLFKSISKRGTLFAVLAALTVAGYTLWDKVSITQMQPFLYFYLYTFLVSILYNVMNFTRFSTVEIKNEWKTNRGKIIQVGFFNSFTYLLILTALTMSKVTYVGGLRQLSIVVGAFLGYRLLGETLTVPKVVGITISIIGGSLIYLAE